MHRNAIDPSLHTYKSKELIMTLSKRLSENVRACFSGIWIQSCEHEDALLEIARLCHSENWKLATWDVDQGMRIQGQSGDEMSETTGADPLAAVRALGEPSTEDNPSLLVLVNFHRFLNSAEIVQSVARQIVQGKNNRTFVVILTRSCRFPRNWKNCLFASNMICPTGTSLKKSLAASPPKMVSCRMVWNCNVYSTRLAG